MPFQFRLALTAVTFAALASSASAADPSGGVGVPEPPHISRVGCLADAAGSCPSGKTVARGRSFQIRGQNLELVEGVIFLGRRGRRDNTTARVDSAGQRAVVARAPTRARSGRLLLVESFGRRTRSRRAVKVRPAPALDLAPGSRFFYGGKRKPSFSFEVSEPGPVTVDLATEATGATVRSWQVDATPDQPAQVSWNGKGASGVVPTGSYSFRLTGAVGAQAGTSEPFFFADHLFPIRGKHNLGYTETNNFGGGRGHQGQDMFAKCGTRLAAARGGRVEYAGYHSAAGNYLVIDGRGTGVDYAYMHLLEPALVKSGDKVFTGQKIGEVGETGRATGCHLHFEMWGAPGWYEGGKPFDPLPSLRTWDRYS